MMEEIEKQDQECAQLLKDEAWSGRFRQASKPSSIKVTDALIKSSEAYKQVNLCRFSS